MSLSFLVITSTRIRSYALIRPYRAVTFNRCRPQVQQFFICLVKNNSNKTLPSFRQRSSFESDSLIPRLRSCDATHSLLEQGRHTGLTCFENPMLVEDEGSQESPSPNCLKERPTSIWKKSRTSRILENSLWLRTKMVKHTELLK